jgi:hypothetical protein
LEHKSVNTSSTLDNLVHKVARAYIRDDYLCLSYVDNTGRTYSGPFYPSRINNEKTEASHIIEKTETRRLG